jgi:hypothetical protein
MRLPNADLAIIPEGKLRDYLLNPDHPSNGGKAHLFAALGYRPENWSVLAADLRDQHLILDAIERRPNLFGVPFEIVGILIGPTGSAIIRSIWQIDYGSEVPRFITAYPQ